jgi:hypothetical protein
MLPDEKTLANIIRHEGHLGKQLSQALREYQRMQESRRNRDDPLPTVDNDVTNETDPPKE